MTPVTEMMPAWCAICDEWFTGKITAREFVMNAQIINMDDQAIVFLRRMGRGDEAAAFIPCPAMQ